MTAIRVKDDHLQRLKAITVAGAAWTGIAALFLLQRIFPVLVKGAAPVWDRLAVEVAVIWGTWALLTPLILFFVRRLPLSSDHPGRMLVHVPIGIATGLLHSLLVSTIMPLLLWRPSLEPIRDMFAGRLAGAIAFETLIYFLVAAVLCASIYATESKQREIAIGQAEESLARARREAQELEEKRQALALLLDGITSRSETESLTVPERDGLVKVPVGSIDWLQAEDNYVRLHAAGRSHLLRTTLGALEKRLASRDFVRIHRSAVVSVSRIVRLKRVASDRYAVVLSSGAQLRVSRAYRKRVIAAVGTPLTPE
jgi:DNA-binding LytR/AlgR family response regulator